MWSGPSSAAERKAPPGMKPAGLIAATASEPRVWEKLSRRDYIAIQSAALVQGGHSPK